MGLDLKESETSDESCGGVADVCVCCSLNTNMHELQACWYWYNLVVAFPNFKDGSKTIIPLL